jgi:hypothetical protein
MAAAGNGTAPAAVSAFLQIDYSLVANGSGSGKIQRRTFPVPDRRIPDLRKLIHAGASTEFAEGFNSAAKLSQVFGTCRFYF